MDDRQRIAQAKETVQGVHVASKEKKKNSFPYHMQWVLVKKGGVGSKGGAPARGSITITMETGGDGFNQLWLRPVKEQIHRILPLFLGTILSQSGCPLQSHSCEVTNQLPMSPLL